MRRTFSWLLALALVLTGMAVPAMAEEAIYIGVSMQGNQSGFIQYITSGIWEYQKNSAPDVKLEVVFADDDAAKQLSQV